MRSSRRYGVSPHGACISPPLTLGVVGECTTSGAMMNATLITGLGGDVSGIAVETPIPEPSTYAVILDAAALGFAALRMLALGRLG